MFSLVFKALRYLAMYEIEAKPHFFGFWSFYDLAVVESILFRWQNVMLGAPVELALDSLHGHCEGRWHFSSNACGCKGASLETRPPENSVGLGMSALMAAFHSRQASYQGMHGLLYILQQPELQWKAFAGTETCWLQPAVFICFDLIACDKRV